MSQTPYARFCQALRAYFDANPPGGGLPVAVIAVTPVAKNPDADQTITMPVTADMLDGLGVVLAAGTEAAA